ncbi:Deoxyribodipyrimidine photo-lyase [Porphyridium purpureum]|uniref:Deoxyribodipyrimidine photo-lyase n=1 Tax=Porphyridium purpureum TaxID=35688 RepID=A0A5J4Z1B7_PORPP|nr:Deoxyribodipyrimidine photo-lyase [Porphyridium purpureum]|eukprot:POR5948..scf208_2
MVASILLILDGFLPLIFFRPCRLDSYSAEVTDCSDAPASSGSVMNGLWNKLQLRHPPLPSSCCLDALSLCTFDQSPIQSDLLFEPIQSPPFVPAAVFTLHTSPRFCVRCRLMRRSSLHGMAILGWVAQTGLRSPGSLCPPKCCDRTRRYRRTAFAPTRFARALQTRVSLSPSREAAVPTDGVATSVAAPKKVCVVWFRRDLRLDDNPALYAAVAEHKYDLVVPLFIVGDDQDELPDVFAATSRSCRDPFAHTAHSVYLQSSLQSFSRRLKELGGAGLHVVQRGDQTVAAVLKAVCDSAKSTAVFFNARYEHGCAQQDERTIAALSRQGIIVHRCMGDLLFDPARIATAQQRQTRRTTHQQDIEESDKNRKFAHWGTLTWFKRLAESSTPSSHHAALVPPIHSFSALEIHTLKEQSERILHTPLRRWGTKVMQYWEPGEQTAQKALREFIDNGGLSAYERSKSRADMTGAVSKLSMRLRCGELSPRTVQNAFEKANVRHRAPILSRRLYWRDLAYFQLALFSDPLEPIRPQYREQTWPGTKEQADAWIRGQTGYPLVDAAMRELWETGWMSQNVRMIAASFLVHILGVHWHVGLRHFHNALVDADVAINTMMWRNAAGVGVDSWNFSLDPVSDSRFVDPTGAYVRRWIPELAHLPNEHLHAPWLASSREGLNYPERIVTDLKSARERMMDFFRQAKIRHHATSSVSCNERGYDLVRVPGTKSETVLFTLPFLRKAVPKAQGMTEATAQSVSSKSRKHGPKKPSKTASSRSSEKRALTRQLRDLS